MEAEEKKHTSRSAALAVVLLVLFGLLLRSCGLSHDLDAGNTYHPDTPKQIEASKLFLDGVYYFKYGGPDYDGYPYFNSHLAAHCYRGLKAITDAAISHLGIESEGLDISGTTLFWIARILNVLLSTLAIYVVFRIGKENYGTATGLLAGVLLAISPADVVTCHYATSDTTSAFFALLAVLFAGRIYAHGRYRDYALAAVFTVFAFAAKYHGGMAVLPCIIAHVAHHGSFKEVFSRAAFKRVALAAGAGLLALVVAIPALLIEPGTTIKDIAGFFDYTSNFAMTPELKEMSILGRWLFGVQRNYGELSAIFGPILIPLFALGAVVSLWRRARSVILASLPFFYLFVGLTFKPLAQVQYHVLITPLVFLISAYLFAGLCKTPRARSIPAILAICALGVTFWVLGDRIRTENFFFQRKDTRLLMHDWIDENVPADYDLWCPNYNTAIYMKMTHDLGVPWRDRGNVLVYEGEMPADLPCEFAAVQAFDLRDPSLSQFRNPAVSACLYGTDEIRPGWQLPVFQRLPSARQSDTVLLDQVSFYRSGKSISVVPGKTCERYLFSGAEVQDLLIVVRCGPLPTVLDIDIGGERVSRALHAGEAASMTLSSPADILGRADRHFYKLAIRTTQGPAVCMIAGTPLERGTALFNIGRYGRAYPHLVRALAGSENPTVRAMARVCAAALGEEETVGPVTTPLRRSRWTAERMWGTYGISPDYLARLPYAAAGRAGDGRESEVFMLESGSYRADAVIVGAGTSEPREITVSVVDGRSQEVLSRETHRIGAVAVTEEDRQTVKLAFDLPPDATSCKVVVDAGQIERVNVRPDPLRTLERLDEWVFLVRADAREVRRCDDRSAWSLLSRLGETASRAGNHDLAAACRETAQSICAAKRLPVGSTPSAGETGTQDVEITCHAVFENGLVLDQVRLEKHEVRAGEKFFVNSCWAVDDKVPLAGRTMVWIHFIDEKGRVVFQADHPVAEDLRVASCDAFGVRGSYPVSVARDPKEGPVPPGCYRIELGLYVPLEGDKRIRVESAAVPHKKKSITVGTLTVTE